MVFDPQKVSYGTLLRSHFSAAHNPTQIGRQGPDLGRQYRSTIFPVDEEQAKIVAAYIEQLDAAGVFKSKIATTIEAGKRFYKAEDYHQDFMALHPSHPYITTYEQPEIRILDSFLPQLYPETPVLVSDANK